MDTNVLVHVLSCTECFCRLKLCESEVLCKSVGSRLCTSCLQRKPVWRSLDLVCEVHGSQECRPQVPLFIHCQTVRRKYSPVHARLLMRLFSKTLHLSALETYPHSVFVECSGCGFGATVSNLKLRPWSTVCCSLCKCWSCVRCLKPREPTDAAVKRNVFTGTTGVWKHSENFVPFGRFSCGCYFTTKDFEQEVRHELLCAWKTPCMYESAYMVLFESTANRMVATDYQQAFMNAAESLTEVFDKTLRGSAASVCDSTRVRSCLTLLDWLADVTNLRDDASVRAAVFIWLRTVPAETGMHALSVHDVWRRAMHHVPELRS